MSLQDYLDLIPLPNSLKPNFTAWVQSNIQVSVDIQTVLNSMPTAFSIDTAVGVQLDILGQILGVSRVMTFQPDGGFSAEMDDDQYRRALRSKIIQNQWKGTKGEIYDFWVEFFPDTPVLIQDNQDMTMSVLVIGMPNDISGGVTFGFDTETATIKGFDEGYWEGYQAVIRQLVQHGYFTPKPAGVAVNYSFMDNPVFGFDVESTYLKGFDEGYIPTF